jgi:hypothetical protein
VARPLKSESKLTEAADKTAALLEGLQSRLNRVAGPPSSVVPREGREETPDELDRQLREYFVTESGKTADSGEAGVLDQIRDGVIQAIAERILASWERGDRRDLGALEKQVIDRLAERILERMSRR